MIGLQSKLCSRVRKNMAECGRIWQSTAGTGGAEGGRRKKESGQAAGCRSDSRGVAPDGVSVGAGTPDRPGGGGLSEGGGGLEQEHHADHAAADDGEGAATL